MTGIPNPTVEKANTRGGGEFLNQFASIAIAYKVLYHHFLLTRSVTRYPATSVMKIGKIGKGEVYIPIGSMGRLHIYRSMNG